jgi:hypothetical protein
MIGEFYHTANNYIANKSEPPGNETLTPRAISFWKSSLSMLAHYPPIGATYTSPLQNDLRTDSMAKLKTSLSLEPSFVGKKRSL